MHLPGPNIVDEPAPVAQSFLAPDKPGVHCWLQQGVQQRVRLCGTPQAANGEGTVPMFQVLRDICFGDDCVSTGAACGAVGPRCDVPSVTARSMGAVTPHVAIVITVGRAPDQAFVHVALS